MKLLFLDAPYNGEVRLCKETLNYLEKKGYETVGLYASVQFCNNLDQVKTQLNKANIKLITSKAKRTHSEGQILGCDSYHNSLNLPDKELEEIDCYLYVGDGRFHPLALVYGQKDLVKKDFKEVVCNDPIDNKLFLVDFDSVKVITIKYKSSLIKFLTADNIGIINTVKPGQEQILTSYALEERYLDKNFYHFLDDNVSFDQLENFPFIEVWVNTACPRIGFDDQEKFARGIINVNDAMNAVDILAKMPSKKKDDY